MLDKITSVLDNYSGKIKNPFIGTIISVWLIHNWRIPYAIFNFDKECSLQDKINFIADYFGKQNFWSEISNVVGYSFLILLFTFILMAISRTITDSFYKILEPYIITKIDKNEIFTRTEKILLETKIFELEKSLTDKRDEITKAETNIQYLITKRDQLQAEHNSVMNSKDTEMIKTKDELAYLSAKYESASKVISRFDDFIKSLTKNEKDEIRFISKNPDIIEETVSASTKKLLYRLGFLNLDQGNYKININGRLFMEYFDSIDKI